MIIIKPARAWETTPCTQLVISETNQLIFLGLERNSRTLVKNKSKMFYYVIDLFLPKTWTLKT